MTVSIGNEKDGLVFGRSYILERMEAEPLAYGDDFPERPREDRIPLTRRITLEGYVIASGIGAEARRQSVELRRRHLASMTAPDRDFFIRVGDVTAMCTAGELTLPRNAPFSGDEAEHFILRAVIRGGFFLGESIIAEAAETAEGGYFPVWVTEDGSAAGVIGGSSVIRCRNSGDVAVGFTASFSPYSTVHGFRLENPATGQYIACSHSFGSGDRISISTYRDGLYMKLNRGSSEIDLTGFADEGSELFLLPPGDVLLTVGEGSPFRGSVTFREAFVTF